MKRLPIVGLILLAFLRATVNGYGQTIDQVPTSQGYVLRTWEVTDGLRDNHIAGVTRSSDEYLWVTNFSGLFRFDGVRFVRMDKESMPGLPSPWVGPVFAGRDRALWLGLERGGIACWHRNQVETIVPIHPRPTSEVWPCSFAEEHSGAVWCGAREVARVSRASGGKVDVFSVSDGVPAGTDTMVRVTSDDKIWCATSGGCARFDGRRFQPVDAGAEGTLSRPVLTPSRNGGMWAIRGGKLLRYDGSGDRLETFEPTWLREAGQINALHEDHHGTLWIGTKAIGLLCLREGAFERVATSFADISCLAEDQEGNLWVGTWGGGLNRLSLRRFFLRQTQAGTLSEVVQSVCEDTDGKLWVLGRGGQPACVLGPTGRDFSPVGGWPSGLQATVMCADPQSGVWLGTPDGLMRWKDGAMDQTTFHEPVAALCTGREQTLWMATAAGGMFRYQSGRSTPEGSVAGVCALAEDPTGRLWVGTRQGNLFRRENGRLAPVALPKGEGDEEVRFIVPDGGNTVWIGTLLGGLYRWRNGQVLRVPETAEVSLAEIRSLLIEPSKLAEQSKRVSSPQDVFWIGTATGLLRVSREALNGFLDGRRSELPIVACGSNEGLPNVEFTKGALNAGVQTTDGHLWFATNRGVLEIQPGALPGPSASARVIIEEASSSTCTFQPGNPDEWVFPPQPGAIHLRYTLPELRTPERVRFRYRLGRGGDGQWIDARNSREMTIVRSEPMDYRVEVMAMVGDGPWLLPPTSINFTVRAAWWQTGIFRWGTALVIFAVVALGVRKIVMLQMRAQIRRIEQEHAIERERTRIARDMHDELGANLTHIAVATHLAGLEPAEASAGHLDEISAAVRQTVNLLDEIVWAVNPRNDTLEGVVEYIGKFAAHFFASAGIETEIALPDAPPRLRISAEQRRHLFLAVKEAVNNVVKHSGATSAKLSIQALPGWLKIVLTDRGRGFDPATVDQFSNGLVNMRDRMKEVGGRCRIESGHGSGSLITLEFPLPPATDPVRW